MLTLGEVLIDGKRLNLCLSERKAKCGSPNNLLFLCRLVQDQSSNDILDLPIQKKIQRLDFIKMFTPELATFFTRIQGKFSGRIALEKSHPVGFFRFFKMSHSFRATSVTAMVENSIEIEFRD